MLYIFLHLISLFFFVLSLERGVWLMHSKMLYGGFFFPFLFFCSTSLDHFRPAEV